MPTVAILYWDHPVSVVEYAALEMGRALASLGVDVRLFGVMDARLNVKESVVSECLSDPAVANCDMVLSMGGPPLAIQVGDRWLFEIFGKYFHMLSIDAFFYDYCRVRGVAEFLELAKNSPRVGISWVDRDACELLSTLTARPVRYIQFGGLFKPIVRGNRMKRVAVVATMGDELARVSAEWTFEDLVVNTAPTPCQGRPLLEFARAIEAPGPIVSIPNLASEILGIPAEDVYTFEMTRYLAGLDAFQKRRRRKETIDALSDVPIDFFGSGWEPYTGHIKDCRYMGSVPYAQVPDVCREYSVILDFNPGFGHGLHDRVVVGLGNGCRVMTNSCRGIADLELPEPDAVTQYTLGEPNLAELAHQALALPPLEPESLLDFRVRNSQLARMDQLMFQLTQD